MNSIALILLMTFTDTLSIEYSDTNMIVWNNGYLVTNVLKRDDMFVYYTEPLSWLDKNKKVMNKPKKYHLRYGK